MRSRPRPSPQAARDRVHARRDRRRHGDLVVVGADEPGEARARRLGALHPVLPGRALLVPVAQVVGVGVAHGVGEHALRAAVEVDLVLEQREAVADRAAAARRARCAVAMSGLLGVARGRAAGRLEDAEHAHRARRRRSRGSACAAAAGRCRSRPRSGASRRPCAGSPRPRRRRRPRRRCGCGRARGRRGSRP